MKKHTKSALDVVAVRKRPLLKTVAGKFVYEKKTDPEDLTTTRLRLFRLGYNIIPTRGKQALLKGWNSRDFIDRELTDKPGKRTVEQRIAKWPVLYPWLRSTGVRLDDLGSIDIDVDDPIAEQMLAFIRDIAPEIYARAPRRFGGGTFKVALFVLKADEGAELAFARKRSHIWIRPGDPEDKNQCIEIFGGAPAANGHCAGHMGINGPHSYLDDTDEVKKYYRWDPDRPALHEIARVDLPVMTSAQAHQIIDHFDMLAPEAGWTRKESQNVGQKAVAYDIFPETRFDTDKGGDQITYVELCDEFAVHGDSLRCSSSFMPGFEASTDRGHCRIGDRNRHNSVAIYDHADAVLHFPAELAPPNLEKLAGLLKDLAAKTPPSTFFTQSDAVISDKIRPLLKLSPIAYEQKRKEVARDLGVRVALLDRMVESARNSEQTGDIDQQIAEINAEFALVLVGGKSAIMKFEGRNFQLLTVVAFLHWLANKPPVAAVTIMTLGDFWMSHKDRRQYTGIEFSPPGSTENPVRYNLFRGFAVEPKAGDCSRFLAHVKDNIANGDEKTFLWIVGWLAQILQQPTKKMGTALVLRGKQGAGKTKIGEVLGSLIGDHFRKVTTARYVVGNFNAHMAALLVLHADEAFWAGDKASVGALKDLVSGHEHPIEHKGVDPVWFKNYIRLFVSGNEDWSVPAGFGERRWAIFDVGDAHKEDHPYFAAIDAEMDAGGREALLHFLLNFDLSQVNLRTIPITTALLDQQIETMSTEESWWLQTLRDGVLPPRPHGIDVKDTRHLCLKDTLFDRYILHARRQGARHRSVETKIGMLLKKLIGPKLEDIRKDIRSMIGADRSHRIRCYAFPPLAECRKKFNEALGQSIDWGDPDNTEEWQHDAYQSPLAGLL